MKVVQASLRDKLVRAKVSTPTTKFADQYRRPHTCQYYIRISQSGTMLNLCNKIKHNIIRQANCQNNNLIYCLESNICNIKYVGQTRNQIIDSVLCYI